MDRTWMYDRLCSPRGGLKIEFINGVQDFVRKAKELPSSLSDGEIRCPCMKCKCMKILKESDVRHHLYKHGFKPEYYIWTEHGEENTESHSRIECSASDDWDDGNQIEMIDHMLEDRFRQVGNEDTTRNSGIVNVEELPNSEYQKFYDILTSANKPIYEGCFETPLSISVKLLAARSNWRIPQRCVDYFAQMLAEVSPSKEKIPKNWYEATRLASKLGLKVEKIDCCEDDCMLFYKEDKNLNACKFCNKPRFQPRNQLKRHWSSEKYKIISNQNSKNRGSSKGGALHTTGRVSHLDVIEQMSKEKECHVDVDEAFLVTHQHKDGSWVDSRSMETYNTYQKKIKEIAQSEQGSTSGTSDINKSKKLAVWQETVGGKNKGKMYGTADLSSNFTREGTSLFYSSQECCDDDLNTHDARLQKELEELRLAHEEERRAHEEERRAQEEKIAHMEQSMELIVSRLAAIEGAKKSKKAASTLF